MQTTKPTQTKRARPNLTKAQQEELKRYAVSMGTCLQQAYVRLRRGEVSLTTK